MRVYQTDEHGVFQREVAADPDPLRPGRYLIPGGCVTQPPPQLPEDVTADGAVAGQRARWTGAAWIVEPVSAAPAAGAPPPEPPTVQGVKDEAMRRILAIAPEWRQRNLLARAALLTKKRADGRTLTAQEQADWDAGAAVWRRIDAIRARSGAIEANIPAGFTDDRHWPARDGGG